MHSDVVKQNQLHYLSVNNSDQKYLPRTSMMDDLILFKIIEASGRLFGP